MKMVYVGGAQGVGKTTLLNQIERGGALDGKDCQIVYSSALVAGIAQQEFSRSLGSLDGAQRKAVRKQALGGILSMKQGLVVLDSHYTEMTNGIVNIIIPKELAGVIEGYVVVEAPPAVVLSRRINDAARKRPTDANLIRLEIESERSTAEKVAKDTSKQVHIINSDDARAGDALLALLLRYAKATQ